MLNEIIWGNGESRKIKFGAILDENNAVPTDVGTLISRLQSGEIGVDVVYPFSTAADPSTEGGGIKQEGTRLDVNNLLSPEAQEKIWTNALDSRTPNDAFKELGEKINTANTSISTLQTNLTSAQSSIASLDSTKLNKAGGTMTGDLNLSGHKITNVATATNSGDVLTLGQANNLYIGTAGTVSNKVNTTEIQTDSLAAHNAYGDPIEVNSDLYFETTNIHMGRGTGMIGSTTSSGAGALTITNLKDPTNDLDAANKAYVDANSLAHGGIVHGDLDFNSFGHKITGLTTVQVTSRADAATKGYVDDHLPLYVNFTYVATNNTITSCDTDYAIISQAITNNRPVIACLINNQQTNMVHQTSLLQRTGNDTSISFKFISGSELYTVTITSGDTYSMSSKTIQFVTT